MRVLLDLNVIEDRSVFDGLPSDAEIVVPEIAWIELWRPSKASDREHGMRKATELLVDQVDRVFFATGTNDLLRRELQTGLPVADVVDADATERFRDLILDLHGRGAGWALRAYRQNIDHVKPEIDKTIYDGATQKGLMIDGFDAWKALLSPEMLRELRGSDDVAYHRWAIGQVAGRMVAGLHGGDHGFPVSPVDTLYLSRKRSVTLAYVVTTCADSFMWVRMHGIHSQPERRVSNHRNDWDYVTTSVAGSCRFITNDKRARLIHDHVEAVVDELVGSGEGD